MKRELRIATLFGILAAALTLGAGGEKAQEIEYAETPAAPKRPGAAAAASKSTGCVSCHTKTDRKTMHINPGRHVEIPAHERDSWMAFWKRHLEPAAG